MGQKNAQPEIFTYGNRNPQGMALERGSNRIWVHEHGPRGGDELNILQSGANYGWPVISFGEEYWGPIPVGEGSNRTVTSRWDGGLLVTEGKQEPGYGRVDIFGVRRILGLSADNQRLTVKVTTMTQHGENTSTFVYRKMQITEPCQNWSTPCK